MKSLSPIITAISLVAATMSHSHAQVAASGQISFNPGQAPAMLIFEDDAPITAYIVNSNATAILFKNTPNAADNAPQMKLSDVQSVYLFEPKPYRQAMELYQARKYSEAMPIFAKLKDDYKFTKALPNNYSVLGGFYEMECMRRRGDLEALSKAAAAFDGRLLTRPSHQSQFELYALWDGVRNKSWDRVISIGEERMKKKLIAPQRAQVAFCLAQAYEAKKLESKALNAYNLAMIADIGSSHEIAEQSAVAVMRIHLANDDVQTAMKNWGTTNENKYSTGRIRLIEAGAIAALYQFTLGDGKPLPAQSNILLKYKPEVARAETEEQPAEK